jgi:hypothetical protein
VVRDDGYLLAGIGRLVALVVLWLMFAVALVGLWSLSLSASCLVCSVSLVWLMGVLCSCSLSEASWFPGRVDVLVSLVLMFSRSLSWLSRCSGAGAGALGA